MAASSASTPHSEALALLALPDPGTLSEEQLRGAACAWCPTPLALAQSVDLGEREANVHGTLAHWFPRGCYSCATNYAYRALLDHASRCEHCTVDASAGDGDEMQCETGAALRALLREARGQ